MKALLIAALLLPTPVHADWFDHIFLNERRPEVRGYVKRKVVKPYKPAKPKPAPIKHDDTGAHCYPAVTVVGSQWVGDSGAQDSARKGWMEQVRWRHGEAAMDISNAQDIAVRCSRSSVGEAVGQVLHRCEIRAKPCRKGFEK